MARVATSVGCPVFSVKSNDEPSLAPFLVDGWYPEEDWGQWCRGDKSILQGRLLFQSLSHRVEGITLRLIGRYVNPQDKNSHLTINGRYRGKLDLSHAWITIPMEQLEPPYIVRLELSHDHQYRPADLQPSSQDSRPLSYGLSKLSTSYQLAGK